MRKLVFLVVFLTGVGFGWWSVRDGDLGLQIVMMAVGALFGTAFGGALAQIGLRRPWQRPIPTEEELHPIPGMGMSGRDMAANFWRDKGHPPFMKPPRPEYGTHMFDADKNI